MSDSWREEKDGQGLIEASKTQTGGREIFQALIAHPSFKATLTGLRKTRLRKVQICPRLAETKRKNIFLDHMNSRFCLGSSRYWLHKFDQNTTKTASFVRLTLRAGAVKF